MTARLLAAAAGLCLVAGCTPPAQPKSPQQTPGPGCHAAPPPRGYALTGDLKAAVVRPVALCPFALGEPIPMPAEHQRVSWLGGTGEAAVVAEYGTGVDRIYHLNRAGPTAIPGFGGVGHSPTRARDGRIAFLDQTFTGGTRRFRVRVFDPATRATTTLRTFDGPPSGPVWTADGRLALVTDTGTDDAALVVLDHSAAQPRRLAVVGGYAVNVYELGSGDLGVVFSGGDPHASRIAVYDSTGRERIRVNDAWRPIGSTGDGAFVAVHRSTREIGRFEGPGYRTPQIYGVLPAGEQVWHVVL